MKNHKYLSAVVLLLFAVLGVGISGLYLTGRLDVTVPVDYWRPHRKVTQADFVAPKFNGERNSNGMGTIFANGNYVYGAAMNLAWNDLKDSIVHEPIALNTSDTAALQTADYFNQATFTKDDLDEPSFYIKSGFGQSTVDQINKESRAKFPDKSFGDLNLALGPKDIIAYAYFLKKVEYLKPFNEEKLNFGQDQMSVKGFETDNDDQRNNVEILKYWDDDKFILSLKLKDDGDRLIVAKGFPGTDPQPLLDELAAVTSTEAMAGEDYFIMPKLHLDVHHDYEEMIGQDVKNLINGEKYRIGSMFEDIKFDMDEVGAKVENQAGIVMVTSALINENRPKNLILDKPFWVLMERKNSQHPYFILGVNNAEVMEKN